MRASHWLSACYFGYIASIGCFGPYIALYYRQLHLSGWEIGILIAVAPLGMALLAPLWGSLADTFSAHRLVLRIALCIATVVACLLTWAQTFLTFLPLLIILSACLAAVPSILDGYAVTISAREGTSFGRLRVWGSIGYICSVWVVAHLMGTQISPLFLYAYALMFLFTCLATLGLPALQPRTVQRQQSGYILLRNPSVLILLLLGFLLTFSSSILGNYFGIYLAVLGGDVGILSTASILSAISEMPMLIFGGWLLRRYASQHILIVGLSFYLVRMVLYSIPLPLPWTLGVQMLHGLSFGLYLTASVTLMHELVGPRYAATGQGLLNATSQGLGAITGALVSGILLDLIGVIHLFRIATIGLAIALVICLLGYRFLTSKQLASRS